MHVARHVGPTSAAHAAPPSLLPEGLSCWAGRQAWASLRLAEAAHRLASLANFLAFLRYGHYRCVHGANAHGL